MSLLNNNNNKGGKKGNKATPGTGAIKFNTPKPNGKGGAGKRPIKTGGTRGS